ncbi:conserved hypothetical protein [Ricinus communis]|uniref:Uncharacterized protein n=1 Tax=Ricinus communis TaxID=3988 RepID=B9SND1_RICCO|nr:conserved hypothetical protein [Ricinus communis]
MGALRRWDVGSPVPSWELNRVARAKAWASLFLEWREPREAGFTEEQKPPSLEYFFSFSFKN